MPTAVPQTLIIYENDYGKAVIYTTAYDDVQVRDAIIACVNAHGKGAKVRSINADDFHGTG